MHVSAVVDYDDLGLDQRVSSRAAAGNGTMVEPFTCIVLYV